MDASKVWELFFETHFILAIEATFTPQKPYCKNFWWNYNKNENWRSYLGNREQRLLFLVVSQSDIYNEFDFARQVGLANKIGRVEVNLSSPVKKVFAFHNIKRTYVTWI